MHSPLAALVRLRIIDRRFHFVTLNRREPGATDAPLQSGVAQCERGPDLRDAPGFAVRGNGRLEFVMAVYAPVALRRRLTQNGLELLGGLR